MMYKKIIPAVILIATGFLCFSTMTWAHGVSYEMIETSPSVTFKSGFSSGEPITYGEVLIYAPDNAEVEFQNGRTDKNGAFSFLPDRAGIWKVEVNGGMGHKLIFDVDITELNEKGLTAHKKKNPLQASMTIRVLLGISLIFNLCLAASYLRARQQDTAKDK